MHVLLISTYDLGRQPFGLASPAAWLREAGHRVRCLDLSVDRLDEEAVSRADLVAFHLPMHTATRIAAHVAPRIKRINPGAHLCFYGLYAPMNESFLRRLGGETILGGEFEEGLRALAGRLGEKPEAPDTPVGGISLARQSFLVPDRSGLTSLDRYARVRMGDGRTAVVGYTEASRGCKHLCRHCPVVPVYNGRFRIVQPEVVLEDIRRQVEAGAEHITFGDPDFFNGIGHAIPLVRSLNRRHPELTYDITVKVEHLLQHRHHLATLRETGCLFVTSAVESMDDRVLAYLDKGHTRDDFLLLVRLIRQEGLTLNPTFVAFHPWISVEGYRELLGVLADEDLVDQVSPVQLALRLLVPEGSRLLDLPEVRRMVLPFDEAALVYPWKHADPLVDELQEEVSSLVREATEPGLGRREIFSRVWDLAADAAGESAAHPWSEGWWAHRAAIPYLTEPWYC